LNAKVFDGRYIRRSGEMRPKENSGSFKDQSFRYNHHGGLEADAIEDSDVLTIALRESRLCRDREFLAVLPQNWAFCYRAIHWWLPDVS